MKFEFYAVRSKKNGNYFKFIEYCSDGFGKYENSVNSDDIASGCMPQFFTNHEMTAFNKGKLSLYSFRDHERQDIEFVEFTLEIMGVVNAMFIAGKR